MVHAHFENAEAALTRHPGEAQWHADMIIVALDGAVHFVRRIAVERMKERFLGAGLSNRARYANDSRSEEHTSELQSLMRISYAVFCLKKKNDVHLQTNL